MSVILLVEDDEQVRMMMRETLILEEHTVLEATNGKEALKIYQNNQPDLVITDIVMPIQDGVEFIYTLLQKEPEARIIAISGGSTNISGHHLLRTAEQLGTLKTFEKPVDMAGLLQAVQEIGSTTNTNKAVS